MLRFFSLIFVFSALVFSPVGSETLKNSISASVDKKDVQTGEAFTYSIKIQGSFNSPKLTLPKFKDFIVDGTSQSRNYLYRDGGMQLVLVIKYALVATKPGTFTIKEATIEDKNHTLSTEPIVIEVTGKPLEDKIKVMPFIQDGTDI